MALEVNPESALREAVASCAKDPLRFVQFALPWDEPDTPLASIKKPEPWQIEHLNEIRDHLRSGVDEPFRSAIRAAHGTGKSAEASWLGLWAMSTMPDTRCVFTAGSEPQLRTKTAPEFARWYAMCLTKHWFRLEAMSMRSLAAGHEKSWRLDFLPWNEKAPESFAGLHNRGRRVLVLMDEASQIPQPIFDTVEGALSDAGTERLFLIRSNATRSSGPFFEAFHKHRNRWRCRKIDGRDVSFTDKAQIAEWIDAYSLDSDFVRVRILGEWPKVGDVSFFDREAVVDAMRREPVSHAYEPLILGVDVSRFGNDQSVLAFRRGRDACSVRWRTYRGIDTQALAAEVARAIDEEGVDACFVDGGGVGGGVCDRLRALRRQFIEVNFGSKPSGQRAHADHAQPLNKRAEMHLMVRAWLPTAALPDDDELESEMVALEYGYSGPEDRIVLESKADMRARGLPSPDKLDALALTFAEPVALRDPYSNVLREIEQRRAAAEQFDYNPFAPDRA